MVIIQQQSLPSTEEITARGLEAAIHRNPHNLDAWASYGHWLTTHGDPRGEMVTLGLDKAHEPQASVALRGHSPATIRKYILEWLGPEMAQALLVTGEYDWLIQLTWRYGFVWSARVRRSSVDLKPVPSVERMLGVLRRSSASRFLYSLGIGLPDWGERADFQDTIAEVANLGVWSSVRKLYIGDYERSDEMELSWTTIGNIEKVYAAFPNLEDLKVQGGGIGLGRLQHAKLQTLALHTAGLPKGAVRSLGAANLPSLRHLEIWFGDGYVGAEATPDMLIPLLLGKGMPSLRRLGLMNAEFSDESIDILAESPVLAQLEALDLSMGTLTAKGAERLIYHAAKFKHLSCINVNDNFLTIDAVHALLRVFGASVESHHQKVGDGDNLFYVSVGE